MNILGIEVFDYDYDSVDSKQLEVLLEIVNKEIEYYRKYKFFYEEPSRRNYVMRQNFRIWCEKKFSENIDYKIKNFIYYRLTHYKNNIEENDCYQTLRIIKKKIESKKEVNNLEKNKNIQISRNKDSDVKNVLQGLSVGCLIQFGIPIVLFFIFFYSFNDSTNDRDNNYHKYTGYCELVGTYRNRYVKCYGDYSPNAREAAENKAAACNNPRNPDMAGCTAKFK